MLHPSNEIIETRLNQWLMFFESEQSEAMGHGAVVPGIAPQLSYIGAASVEYDVDSVIDAAIASGDPDLIGLAELVGLHAENFMAYMDIGTTLQVGATDEPDYVPTRRTGPPAVTMDELEAALAGK